MMAGASTRAWRAAGFALLALPAHILALPAHLAPRVHAETPPDRIFQQPPARATPAPGPAARPVAPRPARPTTPSPATARPETDANRPAIGAADAKVLVDLSEVLGALAFLHGLCSPSGSNNPWRARMEAFLDAEAANSGVGDMLRGAYNHGFTALSASHRHCNDSARAANALFQQDAGRLAREADRKFGG